MVYRTFGSVGITGKINGEVVRELARAGCRFICHNGGFDPDFPVGGAFVWEGAGGGDVCFFQIFTLRIPFVDRLRPPKYPSFYLLELSAHPSQAPATTKSTSPRAPLPPSASPTSPPLSTPPPPTPPSSSSLVLCATTTLPCKACAKAPGAATRLRRWAMTRRAKCWGFWAWGALGGI